jgi:hypothetical protein
VLTKYGICTLVNVVIADSTWTYLFLWSCTIQKICCFWCSSIEKTKLLRLTPYQSILPFNNWNIWMFTQTCGCVFTQLCQCHYELEKATKPSSLCFDNFFSSKKFNHVVKLAIIFHFKSGDSCRLNYFLTSTFSAHIPSPWPIYYKWLVLNMEKYNWPIISCRFLTWIDFDT